MKDTQVLRSLSLENLQMDLIFDSLYSKKKVSKVDS